MPLFVCATPIGNLDDASPRLLDTLRSVAAICAEDTRVSSKLLARFEIRTPLISNHQHTSPEKINALVQRLIDGESLALITDAGTPGISDPGPALVREAAARGVQVIAIAGPCALAAALSISGFDAQKFSFLGFLPRKPSRHKKALQEALDRNEAVVLYESPHRARKTLQVLAALDAARPIVACRELSKKFEETLRGTAPEIVEVLAPRKELLGEWTIIIGPAGESDAEDDEEE
jgi:16S rRNA (cytidine1402-2'-O)-methyltransferase